jgi:hypothetical protein
LFNYQKKQNQRPKRLNDWKKNQYTLYYSRIKIAQSEPKNKRPHEAEKEEIGSKRVKHSQSFNERDQLEPVDEVGSYPEATIPFADSILQIVPTTTNN